MKIICVSPTGSDITGDGSASAPYQTIDFALTVFASGDQIRLFEGTYTPSDSIVLNNLEGSIFADYPGSAVIRPALCTSAACISIMNSNRFTIQGVEVKQDPRRRASIGILGHNVDNFICKTCTVDDFIVTSGLVAVGIKANGSGRIDNCNVYDFTSSADEVYGIHSEDLHIIDCETYEISGTSKVSPIYLTSVQAISGVPSDSQFYVDNVNITYNQTKMIRGNSVYDCYGRVVRGIEVENCPVIRLKDNNVVRMRSRAKLSHGYYLKDNGNICMAFNVASRCNENFYFENNFYQYIYNLTSHNTTTHIRTLSNGYFYNLALSVSPDWKDYNTSVGFVLGSGVSIAADYVYYYGLGSLSSGGSPAFGTHVEVKHLLYFDEQNDDLTPDHISEAVKAGTADPLDTTDPSIGGIQSEITDEYSADRLYQYELIDNSFWNVEDDYSAEMSFIKAFQSRILANSELAIKQAVKDFYIKTAESTLAFSELYPSYTYYQNSSLFKKKIMNLWYSGQNVGTILAYNTGIGGYHLLTSYFSRLEDWDEAWIIDVSYIDVDNYLLGQEAQKYGILIDMLGVSTLSYGAFEECYNNVMNCIADVAEVKWNLHNEVQPTHYVMFSDLYNGFENCELDNMFYNDDLAICIDQIENAGQITTPLIPTDGLGISGSASGFVELSTLERIFSESVNRTMYYRIGDSLATMGSWTQITKPIGEILHLEGSTYVQFKLNLSNILRRIDYEFLGLCIRFVQTDILPRHILNSELNST